MKRYVEMATILDESGSMRSRALETITGFNNFLDEQRSKGNEVNVSLVKFSSSVTTVFEGKELALVKNISPADYAPGGQTSLLDAIGETIVSLEARTKSILLWDFRPCDIAVAIITDGQENNSTKWKVEEIVALIKEKREKFNWKFYFFGTNDGVSHYADTLGIPPQNVITFGEDPSQLKIAFDGISEATNLLLLEGGKKSERRNESNTTIHL